MNILVCLKQILDPEIPGRDFHVDAVNLEAERGTAGLVTNIFAKMRWKRRCNSASGSVAGGSPCFPSGPRLLRIRCVKPSR